MKIQIDTESKVIRIDEKINLADLMDEIKKLLPGEWKKYSIETGYTWYYPYYPTTYYPCFEIQQPFTTVCQATLTTN